MEVIAYKSRFTQYYLCPFCILTAILTMLCFSARIYIWMIVMAILFILCVALSIFWFIQPHELIKLNGDTLEINCRKGIKHVTLTDITSVDFYINKQYPLFKRGSLYLITKNERIRVDNVAKINEVVLRIKELTTIANYTEKQ